MSSGGTKRLTKNSDGVQTVAVIDIGASSIRMAIAEIRFGTVKVLERLIQGVALGKDTFHSGAIKKGTIEDCVRVLRSYRQKLDEYQVTQADRIRVVATSAVREASNRMTFLDRLYSSTGFLVEPIDDAEVNRVTYLGILPMLRSEAELFNSLAMVVEVGGGSTETLLLKGGDVVNSQSYRLGALRLRETLSSYSAPALNARRIMEAKIDRTIVRIREYADDGPIQLVALGGDIRFATSQIADGVDSLPGGQIVRLSVEKLDKFVEEMLALSVDEIINRFHMTLSDAETLGPALLTYSRFAKEFSLPEILVADFNLRGALLNEMAGHDGWATGFRDQIINSALDLAAKYDVDLQHARHVAILAKQLFDELSGEHGLDARWETILTIAALLHESGLFLSPRSYHKHSMYIINNSKIFGLSPVDSRLVSLVARYHRRAIPKPTHDGYSRLDRDTRIAVSKAAAILRLAVCLDHSRSQRIQSVTCELNHDRLLLLLPGVEDVSLEQLQLKQSGQFFESVFGRRVMLRSVT
ncbi:Ppx/GppA family phosphatase [bacterium]|nr:Ppx/GppA family phosphatase [bacterium]